MDVGPALTPSPPTDRDLIGRFIAGDDSAFAALHARHDPRLRALLRRILGSHADELDDVVQDTWLAGCRGLSRFEGQSQFFTWLATIGIRGAYDRAARNGRVVLELPADLAAPPIPDTATTIDLENAIAQLAAMERTVVVLHDIEGYSHDEIGRQLGIATGTSRNVLSRARAMLRTLLNEGAPHDR
jgi:RNA polymerase sigma-70 factor (ECF subfamily)